MREPHVACIPRTQMLSLRATGLPSSAPPLFPLSNSFARRVAPSRSICRKALSVPFRRSAASSARAVTAEAVALPPVSSDVMSSIVLSGASMLDESDSAGLLKILFLLRAGDDLRHAEVAVRGLGRLLERELLAQ